MTSTHGDRVVPVPGVYQVLYIIYHPFGIGKDDVGIVRTKMIVFDNGFLIYVPRNVQDMFLTYL